MGSPSLWTFHRWPVRSGFLGFTTPQWWHTYFFGPLLLTGGSSAGWSVSGRESGFADVEAGSSAGWASEEETCSPPGWRTGPLCRGPALFRAATAFRCDDSEVGDIVGRVCTIVSSSWLTAVSTAGDNLGLSNSSITRRAALTIGPSSLFNFHLRNLDWLLGHIGVKWSLPL